MRRLEVWHGLALGFIAFWLVFACILIFSNFPFMIISMALTTLAALSFLVIVLAWAYQKNI